MTESTLEGLIADGRTNAALAWVLVAAIAAVGVGELLTGGLLWATFAAVLVALALLPPIAFRSTTAMLPWEVLLLAALPVLGMALGADRLTGHFAAYLSVAAVALVLAVELQSFTSVQMTPSFAVIFVVVATMAAAGLWALLRWSAAQTLGIPFTEDHDAVMWEFVYSAIAGLGAGVVFELYFRRLADPEVRLPADVAPAAIDGPTALDHDPEPDRTSSEVDDA
ncbi:hypothetical protein [Halopiger xanaduensis]|uniref:Uncharacterized protein n=1 Tax=Halopiger xanaduensis (strain DSM 18323 / JCM 14033 / SH-6) TaxID=797210 RepID=F8D8T4_HALXS|nr:hypothetical protein [Halopiger xanaduensis]AEH37994.1 hypothetical protein Halxa_3382 [Halopiger xanaduensis SH-6]